MRFLRRLGQFLDWRFFASIAAVLAVSILSFQTWDAYQSDREKSERIDALVAEQQVRDQASAESREKSAAERERLLKQNARILAETNELQDRLLDLIEFLNRSGIDLPDDLSSAADLTPESVPPSQQSSEPSEPTESAGDQPTVEAPDREPQPRDSGTPTPSPTPEPTPQTPAEPSATPTPLLGVGVCVLVVCL